MPDSPPPAGAELQADDASRSRWVINKFIASRKCSDDTNAIHHRAGDPVQMALQHYGEKKFYDEFVAIAREAWENVQRSEIKRLTELIQKMRDDANIVVASGQDRSALFQQIEQLVGGLQVTTATPSVQELYYYYFYTKEQDSFYALVEYCRECALVAHQIALLRIKYEDTPKEKRQGAWWGHLAPTAVFSAQGLLSNTATVLQHSSQADRVACPEGYNSQGILQRYLTSQNLTDEDVSALHANIQAVYHQNGAVHQG